MKVAIVHDYFHDLAGAEKVVESWLEIYPKADIYTAFFTPEKMKISQKLNNAWQENRVFTTFEQKIFKDEKNLKWFKIFFWLHPILMSFLTIKNYDLVLISSVYCGKNPKFLNNRKIIHYCHSPARFLYRGMETELNHEKFHPFLRFVLKPIKFILRKIDQKASQNLIKIGAKWLVNSEYNRGVIAQIYGAKAEVCYPKIEWEKFIKNERKVEKENPFFLYYGRIVHIKRPDLAIKTCLKMGKRLVLSGNFGTPEYEKELKNLVKNDKNGHLITFLGRISLQENLKLFEKCEAMLFPGREDFGIAPVELLFAGVPVIAYKKAGALEYIKDGENGVFFDEQNEKSLQNGIERFEKLKKMGKFSPEIVKKSVEKFKKSCQF